MSAHSRAFILQHTRLESPPLVREIRLYLAVEVMPLWHAVEEELGEKDAPPPYWAFAWAGGQAIARYLLDHPAEVAGKHVFDFAAGSGLCAVAVMKAGASSALAADIDPCAREAIALNAAANNVHVTATGGDLLDAYPPEVDLILAGDIWYEEPLAQRALPWLRAAHRRGIRVLIGDPGRDYSPRGDLIRLHEYEVPVTRDLEGVEVKRASVLSFPD